MMEALGEEPAMSVESLVTEESVVMALREVLPLMNTETATLKMVMQKLAVRFGMEFVDFKAQWRSRVKELLPDMIGLCQGADVFEVESEKAESDAEGDEEDEEIDLRPSRKRTPRTANKRNAVVDASDEEEENDVNDSDASEEEAKPEEDEDESEDDVVPAKKRRTTSDKSRTNKRKSKESAPPAKKSKTTKEEDPVGLALLKELGRAAGILSPQLYRVLKSADSTEEAEEILRDRLQDVGVTFHGSYPTSRDISAAKKKHDKEKELEGIDTSLIITGGRSRRGGSERISYREEIISGEEDNDEDEDDKEDADEEDGDSDSSEASF
ncbi:hypothetical protein V7S43_001271 [Phytophthora oleae]|uniref:DEK C-terminal domain-containing protein n=1 Tax=Phytophthora oleae TaxID=2107226 RepID=A0ABD3G4H8_9STRA